MFFVQKEGEFQTRRHLQVVRFFTGCLGSQPVRTFRHPLAGRLKCEREVSWDYCAQFAVPDPPTGVRLAEYVLYDGTSTCVIQVVDWPSSHIVVEQKQPT